jgi:RimJ/RimL family protein N-acetyltransferase
MNWGTAALLRLETERLTLREIRVDDDEFMLELLTEPSFLHFIGDKGVRTIEETRQYIIDGPVDSYRRHGLGMYIVELKASGTPIGMAGLKTSMWVSPSCRNTGRKAMPMNRHAPS